MHSNIYKYIINHLNMFTFTYSKLSYKLIFHLILTINKLFMNVAFICFDIENNLHLFKRGHAAAVRFVMD